MCYAFPQQLFGERNVLIDPHALARMVASFSDPADQAAEKSKELTLHLLEHSPAPFSRSQFIPGHITTTGVVLHPDCEAVLLIYHRRLERWLLPGGHVELEDMRIFDAARREVLEETGAQLPPEPDPPMVGIDVHGIPPNKREPLHYHHDLIFGFRAPSGNLARGHEVREARWFEIAKLGSEVPELPASIGLSIVRSVKQL
jgi:8-oxo-dGTP pyrophosphatase MutT (NUDIX family)